MEIEATELYTEAQRIINGGETGSSIAWSATVHLSDGSVYIPMQVLAVNTVCDFANNFADEMTATFMIPLGKFARRIYPSRDNIEISLIKTIIGEQHDSQVDASAIEAERYTAYLINGDRSPTVGQGRESLDEETLDRIDILNVSFQLTNKWVDKMRTISIGTILRSTTVQDAMFTLLNKIGQDIKVDNKRVLQGVDIVPPNNKAIREHIHIPQRTKLYDLCNHFQNTIGVYNAGLGTYVHKNKWYVYPLFDTTRFYSTKQTVTILVLPQNKMPQLPRTYRTIGNSTMIVITSDTKFRDDASQNFAKFGSGMRLARADNLLQSPTTKSGNKAVVNKDNNIYEFRIDELPTGANHYEVPEDNITSNPYKHYSALLNRKGGSFRATWENSNPNILIPGMPIKICYFDEDKTKEIYATLIGAEHVSIKTGDVGTKRHIVNTLLHLFVNQKNNQD